MAAVVLRDRISCSLGNVRNRGYINEARLRGLLKPAEAGFVCVGANSIRQLH